MKFIDTLKIFDMDSQLNEGKGFFDDDVDYLIKDGDHKNTYVVTSWIKGKQPKNIYMITHSNNKWNCNCPAKIKPCKHIDMVRNWIKKGKKTPFDLKK
jgi:hypothetical protein